MKVTHMIINITDPIFTSEDFLLDFLIANSILQARKRCDKDSCDGIMLLVKYSQRGNNNLVYRCNKRTCRKRKGIFSSKIPPCKLLNILFLLLNNCSYHQLHTFHGISTNTTHAIKKLLRKAYKSYMLNHPVYLGGPGILVEADETVLSRRGVITSPTSLSDETKDTVWILGAIDNTPERNFFIKRVQDRTITSISNALEGVIREGSRLCTDGYRSYPRVAEILCLEHSIVNHSMGFVANDGTHTNNQEAFWSHLKATMRKEHGVKRENIDEWISDYTFKRRYIVRASRNSICTIFIELLKYILNE